MDRLTIVPIASKSQSANSWTGIQCLKKFIDDVESGKVQPDKVIILWFTLNSDGSVNPHHWYAQIDRCEEIALLETAKQLAIGEWIK